MPAPTKTDSRTDSRATDTRPEARVFISPAHPNTRYLVERGPALAPGENELNRQDIFAEFVGGLCHTRDPKVIAFLEVHQAEADEDEHLSYHLEREQYAAADDCKNRAVCMDAANPKVMAWADIEGRKQNLSNRDAQLPSGYNTDALLRGEDPLRASPVDLVSRAQDALHRANQQGQTGQGGQFTNNPERFHLPIESGAGGGSQEG